MTRPKWCIVQPRGHDATAKGKYLKHDPLTSDFTLTWEKPYYIGIFLWQSIGIEPMLRCGGFLLALTFSRHFHMICLTNSKNPPRIVNNPLKKWGKVPSPKSINAEMHWCFYKFQCYQILAYFVKMYYMMIELEQVQRKEGVRL